MIPRWFYRIRYEIINGDLVKTIGDTFIENGRTKQ